MRRDPIGWAIYNVGTLNLSSCAINANKAVKNGGGIGNVSNGTTLGTLTLNAARITNNTASGYGGGICNTATAALTNVTITGNAAAKNGGGICNSYYQASDGATSSLLLTLCSLGQNTAVYGGGLLNASTASLYGSSLTGNTASQNGGGISNSNGKEENNSGTANAVLILADSETGTATTLTGNTAVYGAGIGQWGTRLDILGATSISGNGSSATVHGGGVFVFDSDGLTIASTAKITGNTPDNVYDVNSASAALTISGPTFRTSKMAVLSTATPSVSSVSSARPTTETIARRNSRSWPSARTSPRLDPAAVDALLAFWDIG